MDWVTTIFVAFGLAMDCFAVSVTGGITAKNLRVPGALKVAMSFGVFQAGMLAIGWLAGRTVIEFISGIDHWLALALLSFIGCKMIYDSIKTGSKENETDILNTHVLLTLSVVTSIDALAAGLSFAFLSIAIVVPIVVIGAVTFLLSSAGFMAGKMFGHLFERKVGIVGGLILIAIGAKILLEHLA